MCGTNSLHKCGWVRFSSFRHSFPFMFFFSFFICSLCGSVSFWFLSHTLKHLFSHVVSPLFPFIWRDECTHFHDEWCFFPCSKGRRGKRMIVKFVTVYSFLRRERETSAKGTKTIIIMGETEGRAVHSYIWTHTIYPSSQTGGIILVSL